tara:strand:- start:45 stop:461 length:417 start_codon:yes stop_codon:yes gene_type:complete
MKTREEWRKDCLLQMPELHDANSILEENEMLKDKIHELNSKNDKLEIELKESKSDGILIDDDYKNYLKRKESEKESTIKRMNDINTFQCCDGELCLRGTDEMGIDFTVWWDAYDFLDWIDTEQLKYIKTQIIKYIDSK